jgi:hypothetical protein
MLHGCVYIYTQESMKYNFWHQSKRPSHICRRNIIIQKKCTQKNGGGNAETRGAKKKERNLGSKGVVQVAFIDALSFCFGIV